ncbi:MAG: CRTAC1 family protein [Sandaracinaceae bacterium]
MRLWSLSLSLLLSGVLLGGCESDPCEGACPTDAICDPEAAVCRCGGLAGDVCGVGEICSLEDAACIAPIPAPVCGEGTRWAPGASAFRDVTDAWGLEGVQGTRLSVTDVDGDGWADLEVRRGAPGPDGLDGVRRTFLLRNTGEGFEDITEASNVLVRRTPDALGRPVEVVVWGDIDNDGDLDMFSGLGTDDLERSVNETTEVLLNDGTGVFSLTDAANPLRRPDAIDMPGGASFVDIDRDGFLDLWVPQHNTSVTGFSLQNDRLWRGDGTGTFVDAIAEAGVTTQDWVDPEAMSAGLGHNRAWGAAACDLDNDGWPDLLASSYGRSPNHLWRSNGDGTYENHSVASGYAYDENQAWDDNQFARCYCQSNAEAEGCAAIGAPVVSCQPNWNHDNDRQAWRLGGNSGGTYCADIDNDGDMDLLTTEIRHWWAGQGSDGSELLVNDGTATFARPGDASMGMAIEHTGTTWDEGHITGAVFDFDNDGWNDVYIGATDYAGNRGRLYHQDTALAFTEVAPADGIDHNRSHGIVVADFDRDGDLDVVVGHSRGRCDANAPNNCYDTTQVRLFENLAGDGGNFVQLDLEGGPGTNRAAIGARVTVTAGGVSQTQEVGGGHGHYGSQNDRVLHFGLGGACEADVTVRWPNAEGRTETFTLPAGHRFHIIEGGLVEPVAP